MKINMDNFFISEKVTWLYWPRGGYGYCIPVNAIIIKKTKNRIKIEVEKITGEKVFRYVSVENLRKDNK